MQHQPLPQLPVQEGALHQGVVERKPVVGAVERDARMAHEIAHAHAPVVRLFTRPLISGIALCGRHLRSFKSRAATRKRQSEPRLFSEPSCRAEICPRAKASACRTKEPTLSPVQLLP
jgi:hypothetical protein